MPLPSCRPSWGKVSRRIENLKRPISQSNLTDTEVGQLPEGTKVYESTGRMFLLSDMKTVRSGLKRKNPQPECQKGVLGEADQRAGE